jgi:hypothetical protein
VQALGVGQAHFNPGQHLARAIPSAYSRQ